MNIMAFVPARGGSKGILRKNLVQLAGKPLLQHTLDHLKALGDTIIPFISTDDVEIEEYCIRQGFDMSYQRPHYLAQDDSSIIDAVLDGLSWVQLNRRIEIDAVLLLQPTNPLRLMSEVLGAITYFLDENIDSLVSVTTMKEHPYECIEINKNGWSYLRIPTDDVIGRQQYQHNFFFIDGSFYLARVLFLKKYKQFVKEGVTKPFYLQRTWPIDIDVLDDLKVAEVFL